MIAKPRDIAIIGAGPAGLFAAERLAKDGHRITIFDRMAAPARKFLMAGRGGLNLTHSEPLANFLQRYPNSPLTPHLHAAIQAFPPQELVKWANGLGQETFIGSSGRVFPKSMKASPLLRAWIQRLTENGVQLKLRYRWLGFQSDGTDAVKLRIEKPSGEIVVTRFDAVVLALGGASWARLGSDGAWHDTLKQAGIDLVDFNPGNAGVHISWTDHFKTRFAGKPLKKVRVSIPEGKTAEHARGDLVITQTGLEGGPVYALNPLIRAQLADKGYATIEIDLKPDVSLESLSQRLQDRPAKQSRANWLRRKARLDATAIALINEAGAPPDPENMAAAIKQIRLKITRLSGLDRAISTVGGVAASAIGPDWMLRELPGVFVAGEMVDWDAPTGGYLLQACFASAAAAAQGVNSWLSVRR